MTAKQQLILDLVRSSCAHCTAEKVFEEARKEMPGIGLATVYRNLSSLAEDGVIRRIYVSGEPDRFDKTVEDHDHAVCKNCGRMIDVNVGDIKKQIEESLKTTDFTYDLCIHDYCTDCRQARYSAKAD